MGRCRDIAPWHARRQWNAKSVAPSVAICVFCSTIAPAPATLAPRSMRTSDPIWLIWPARSAKLPSAAPEVGDRIRAIEAREVEAIRTVAADEQVVAPSAMQHIVAVAAIQDEPHG